ncbi:Uncharacterised protein [Candidatus Burarchaeum australiense]|nr:Uncharacterised protein [Candidatus Burarchaeum australiense]
MFGFGQGSVDIKLNNFNFRPGDTIEGTVLLKLKGPVKARELSVTLAAISHGANATITFGGSPSAQHHASHNNDRRIFELKNTLDSEKEYPATPEPLAYPFRIVIPQQIPSAGQIPQFPGEVGGAVTDLLKFLASGQQVKWYLMAKLDVPMAADVSRQVQINLA